MLKDAVQILKAPLATNQVEMHPFIDQTNLRPYKVQAGLPLEVYAPCRELGGGRDPT